MADMNREHVDSREAFSSEEYIDADEMLNLYAEAELDELWSESTEEEELACYYDEFENTFDLYDGE